ncbi:D-2-hydroxyacid dehydrogenase [Thalassobacillus sp. CUG 92003]|uniref:D-2-hydroxyacid dehydrogenase n=1 Tax=Thalassobacillus sp. CUG 92003 TaxID=2736641 RepID=UPI0015E6DE49|nr:D-2-hydroxyacid dehydrogenase [Thalassobacillus sp. CUG 92003]
MLLITTEDLTSDQLAKLTTMTSADLPVEHITEDLASQTSLLPQVRIWITYGHDVTPELIAKMPNLIWVQIFQAGVEHLPFDELHDRNIQVTNMKGIQSIPMAEYTLSMMFHFNGNITRYQTYQNENHWETEAVFQELHGQTVTIMGAGTIGIEIAAKCKALNMTVYGVNTTGHMKPPFDYMYKLEDRCDALQLSDYVILLMPVTESTTHCMSDKEYHSMKPSAFLINLGRGPLIDDHALLQAIDDHEIAGAALDVFDQEPLPSSHPFWNHDKIIVTPHVAAKSPQYMDRCLDKFAENYHAFMQNDHLLYLVDLTKGY